MASDKHSGGERTADVSGAGKITSVNVSKASEEQRDIFREYPIRYLGYANEVGEAFRSFVHVNIVRASYGIASCYVIADATNKGLIAYKKFNNHPLQRRLVVQGVVDTLIWQGLASVIIPGFTINRICWMSTAILSQSIPIARSKGISTVIGLAAIPFIIKPIDMGVDFLMEHTFRKKFDHCEDFNDKHVVHHNRND